MNLPCKEIHPSELRSISSPLSQKIVQLLVEKPSYPKKIAAQLKMHEQKIYYHIRNLEKAEIIKKVKTEAMQGAIANYYALTQPSFVIRFRDFKETRKLEGWANESEFLEPFIENGQLKANIIVGSPDPHGPEKARARDGYYGIDLALFLGTFLSSVSNLNVRLDTEAREEDLKKNIIVIGGPVVNSIASKINKKSPIRFEGGKEGRRIFSNISNKNYHNLETGFIVKMTNPFDKTKKLLYIAGNRYAGTRACIVAFLKRFESLSEGNKYDKKIYARVVEGIDLDSDGIIDDIEFKE